MIPDIAGLSGQTTKSYLIPVGDLSLAERASLRRNTDQILTANALRQAIRTDPHDLLIRDIFPLTDLGLAATDDFLIAAAGVAGTDLQYCVPTIGVTQCIGIYGMGVESAALPLSRVRFTLGTASSQVRGAFQLEQLYMRLETVGYFSEAIIFVKSEVMRIMVMPRIAFAAATCRAPLYGRIIEPIGAIVSAPSVG